MGVGPAFFDVDRDGDPDLMFANGADWPEKRASGGAKARRLEAHRGAWPAAVSQRRTRHRSPT